VLPLGCAASEGLPVREELRPYSYSSSGIGMRSGWKAGNLNVVCGLGSRAEEGAMANALGVSRGCVGCSFVTPWGPKGCDLGCLELALRPVSASAR
jgi:hypothetical protein